MAYVANCGASATVSTRRAATVPCLRSNRRSAASARAFWAAGWDTWGGRRGTGAEQNRLNSAGEIRYCPAGFMASSLPSRIHRRTVAGRTAKISATSRMVNCFSDTISSLAWTGAGWRMATRRPPLATVTGHHKLPGRGRQGWCTPVPSAEARQLTEWPLTLGAARQAEGLPTSYLPPELPAA